MYIFTVMGVEHDIDEERASAGDVLNLNRVLLVDDNPVNLQVLYQALEQEGYELLIAQSGEEALQIAVEAKPALILLDINMPGMDGFETCERLKADAATREMVIIFLSARDQVQDKVKGLKLGAVDYVSKPFQFEEVVARVNTQLELRRAKEELRKLHQQADALLLNILPRSIAERLKASERNIVDSFPEATILFCDLVGFTPLAAQTTPGQLVEFLNGIFSAMDQLVEKYGLEKIKTIGDAYMLAGGVPDPRLDHASAVADFALDLVSCLPALTQDLAMPVRLRIGIHSGPVVAGVIGEKKFAYDLWGDTVNTASRMESSGSANRIHVSQASRDLLGAAYGFEKRGSVSIKGKGEMDTYFLLAQKEGGAS
ncbi:MAG: response regulator [Verrucomicrobiales bacterium]|nr:response regulator [Verrucomicrobiales bacterium]